MSTQIPFTTYVQRLEAQGPEHMLTVDELWQNRKSQSQSLFEWIQTESETKLYFDFDEGDFDEALKFYVAVGNKLKCRWTLCGYYTSDAAEEAVDRLISPLPKEQFNWCTLEYIDPETIKTSKVAKELSFHVVYDVCVNRNDMFNVTRALKCPFIDTSVYKETGKRQLFRHPYYNKGGIKCGLCNVTDCNKPFTDESFKRSFVLNVDESFEKLSFETLEGLFTDELSQYYVKTLSHQPFVKPLEADINAEPVTETVKTQYAARETKQSMSDELAQAFVDGIKGITIHGMSNLPMEQEISLYNVFSAVYALPDNFIPSALANVQTHCVFTEKAENTYIKELNNFKRKGTFSYGCLIKLIKIGNPNYFKNTLQNMLYTENKNKTLVDDVNAREDELLAWDFNILTDGFSINDIIEKAPYGSISDVIIDLKRILVSISSASRIFVYKFPGDKNTNGKIDFKSRNEIIAEIGDYTIGHMTSRANTKDWTLWDIYKKYAKYFMMKRLSFHNEEPGSYNIFRGLPYTPSQTLDRSWIQPYLTHIREVIANGNEEVYEYILDWISSIVKMPTFKTCIAIVLTGEQGTGKGLFTDVISRLLGCYAWGNAERARDVVGKNNGNLEHKKLVVINEARDAADKQCLDGKAMKSLITDGTMSIEDKYIKAHNAENVANFIICSNEYHPIELEESDRRYLVTKTSSKHIGDQAYFDVLVALQKKQAFYEHLMRFFMDRDLTNFNSRKPPQTELKDEMKQASWTTIDWFVREKLDELTFVCKSELWGLFVEYATRGNHKNKYTESDFTNEMRAKYIEVKTPSKKKFGITKRMIVFKDGVEDKLREYYRDNVAVECEDMAEKL